MAKLQLVEHCKTLRLKIEREITPFPYMSEIKGKFIRYVDICDRVREDEHGNEYIHDTNNMFINLVEFHTNNIKYNDFALNNFSVDTNKQNRILLNFMIDTEQSNIVCYDRTKFGKYVYILLWYSENGDVNVVEENENQLYNGNSFEVKLTDKKVFFPDNRELYDKKFVNFMLYAPMGEIIPPGEEPVPSPDDYVTYNNNKSITEDMTANVFLTLVKDSTKIMDGIPLYIFLYKDVYNILTFNKIKFDFTLSYLTVSHSFYAECQDTLGRAVMFNAIFED